MNEIVLTGSDWDRDELIKKYSGYDFPYINVGADLDVSGLYNFAKANGISFYCAMIHCVISTAENIPNFHYRIKDDGTPVYWEKLTPSFTYLPKGEEQFYVVEYPYDEDILRFCTGAKTFAEELKNTKTHNLMHDKNNLGVIYISAVPWIHFNHVVRTISKLGKDNIPRITWGRYDRNDKGQLMMPVSVQVHHALMDGYHVGKFFAELEDKLKMTEQ